MEIHSLTPHPGIGGRRENDPKQRWEQIVEFFDHVRKFWSPEWHTSEIDRIKENRPANQKEEKVLTYPEIHGGVLFKEWKNTLISIWRDLRTDSIPDILRN